MKLKEYMSNCPPGDEITCFDKDVDSEFYFYTPDGDELKDSDFPNYDACLNKLTEILDVVAIHDYGVEVNLYDYLDNASVIQYAKDNFYEEYQYSDDSDVVMLLFNDNVSNISQGFEIFSGSMVACLNEAYSVEQSVEQIIAAAEVASEQQSYDVERDGNKVSVLFEK